MAAFNTRAELEAYFNKMMAAGILRPEVAASLRNQWLTQGPESVIDESDLLLGGGGGGGATIPTTPTATVPEYLTGLSEEDILAQYMAQLGIPAIGASPYQRWQTRQALPTAAAYMMQNLQQPKRTFADYLSNVGIMGARQTLPGMYETMMAAEPTALGGAAGTRQSLGGLWNDLLASMTQAKFGRFFGPTLAGAIPQMQAQYEVSPEGYGAPGERGFLQYLRQRYGL